jgi:hypothetical protein
MFMRPPVPLSVMTFPLLFSLDTFMPSGWSNFGSVASFMSRMRSLRDLMETDDAIEESDPPRRAGGARARSGDDDADPTAAIMYPFDPPEGPAPSAAFVPGGRMFDSPASGRGLLALVPPTLVLPLCGSVEAKLNVPSLSSWLTALRGAPPPLETDFAPLLPGASSLVVDSENVDSLSAWLSSPSGLKEGSGRFAWEGLRMLISI